MADKMITTYNSHQSPTTDDKFFMVGASEEYLINYDLLASAILDKLATKTFSGLNNSTVISALQATSYSTVLSASTYNDKAAALAALDSYANNFGGSVRVVGYISTANSNLLGLTNTSHYFDFYVNSANYRLLVARPVNGNTIYQLAKQGSTWGSGWQQLANQAGVDTNSAAITDIDNRFLKLVSGNNITTSNIDTYTTSGLYLGYIECTSITGSGGNSYGLLIVTNPRSDVQRIGQTVVMMLTGYIATRYNTNGTWSDWQKIPTSAQVDANTAAIARHDGTAIASNEDLNNLTSIGEYYALTGAIATTLAHCPVTTNFVLTVLNKGGLRTQILTSADKLYIRTSTSSGWSAWYQYANQSEVTTNASNISALTSKLSDYVKAKTITVPRADLTAGMSLSSYVSLDAGYKFLCWQTLGCSSGWTNSSPIYISDPLTTNGSPFWDGTLPTGTSYSVLFVYFEVKS